MLRFFGSFALRLESKRYSVTVHTRRPFQSATGATGTTVAEPFHLLAVLVGFGLPTLVGFLWDGWLGALGGFLIGGVAKLSCFIKNQ